jgi:chemotaxis regulatin CheY-phosphate phosphatase CheZ
MDEVQDMTCERFITVPVRARSEIGELTYYLEQGLRNIGDITEHLRGSSGTMPGVLEDLRDVVRMTETATVRVLEEAEALVDDGRTAAHLIADVSTKARAGDAAAVAEPMRALDALVERSNARAMEIMSALEFQDLTSQKVQRTFSVLQEVLVRLGKIQRLVDGPATASPEPAPVVVVRDPHDSKAGQRLADELLLNFSGESDD